MTKKTLSNEVARGFFGSLYEEAADLPTNEFDALVTGLVNRIGDNVISGDQALQSLMVNYVMSNSKDLDEVKELSAVLGGIKQRSVDELVKHFPNANLDALIDAAKTAGYDVQVLSR